MPIATIVSTMAVSQRAERIVQKASDDATDAVKATMAPARMKENPNFQPQFIRSSADCPPISDHDVKIDIIATRNSNA